MSGAETQRLVELTAIAAGEMKRQHDTLLRLEGALAQWLNLEHFDDKTLEMFGISVADGVAFVIDHIDDNRAHQDYVLELLLSQTRRSIKRRWKTKKSALLIEAIDAKWREWKPNRQELE